MSDQRRAAYEQWLAQIAKDYPDDWEIRPTRYGCEVFDSDDIYVESWDYDPYPPERDEYRSADY
jgi:hypothetical protein